MFKREATLLTPRHEALPVVIDAFTHDGSRLVMQYIKARIWRRRSTGPQRS